MVKLSDFACVTINKSAASVTPSVFSYSSRLFCSAGDAALSSLNCYAVANHIGVFDHAYGFRASLDENLFGDRLPDGPGVHFLALYNVREYIVQLYWALFAFGKDGEQPSVV